MSVSPNQSNGAAHSQRDRDQRDRDQRDRDLMFMALREAERGRGRTSPNPMVGAVVVKDDRIIATGYHHRAGEPHAERMALAETGAEADGAELFVNLEPCAHQGRTLPCTEIVIDSGLSRVVVGTLDPNPVVAGRGVDLLRQAGISVTVGVLEDECLSLNAAFFKHIRTGLPYVTAKFAMTLDGKIATRSGDSRWISNSTSRRQGHALRDVHDAILVGNNTLVTDNPTLTTRLVPNGVDPIRVVLDPLGAIDPEANVLKTESAAPTWVVCGDEYAAELEERLQRTHEVLRVELDEAARIPLDQLLTVLGRRGILTLLVEGGGETLGSFFANDQIDRVVAFVAPRLFGGREAPTPMDGSGVELASQGGTLLDVSVERFGDDLMITGLLRRPEPFSPAGGVVGSELEG